MGAANFPYPKWVWTPVGGYWPNPPKWKRNTAMMAAAWAGITLFTFNWSRNNERRPLSPVVYPIPSQYWCKYAAEDDARLVAMGWGSKSDEE